MKERRPLFPKRFLCETGMYLHPAALRQMKIGSIGPTEGKGVLEAEAEPALEPKVGAKVRARIFGRYTHGYFLESPAQSVPFLHTTARPANTPNPDSTPQQTP